MHRTPKTFFEIRNERKQEEEKGEEERKEIKKFTLLSKINAYV